MTDYYINRNEEGDEIKNLGNIAKIEHKTSNDIMINPNTKNQNHVQNSGNIDKNIDIEKRDIFKSLAKMAVVGTENILNNSKSLIQNEQQNLYKCYYCDEEFFTEQEHLKHSLN